MPPLPATRHSRRGGRVAAGTSSDQAAVSKHSTLASTYGSPSRPGAKSRGAGPLQVIPPPAVPVIFHGLSPIVSFLASSSHNFGRSPGASPEGVEESETPDGRSNFRIIHGVKYDVYPRNEVPYSMLYDTVTPENELHSYLLVRRLTENGSPSFLHVPTSIPVHDALDLGCGDGHWIAHAAQVWGVHGTKIVGIDLSLSTKDITATLSGPSAENTKLFHHNFITEELPFPDKSFDYVRLNDAVVVIPRERWDFVLSEAYRVLRRGGRLELIHDQLCFPFIGPETPVSCTFAPLTHERRKGAAADASPPHYGKSPYDKWEAEMQNCRGMEGLYLEMLAQRYGVHPQPRDTLVDAIRRQFGGSAASHLRVSNAHVCIPSRDFMERSETSMRSTQPKKRDFGISITIDWGHEKTGRTKNLKAIAAPPAPREFVSLTGLPPVLSKKAANLMGVVQLSPAGAPYQPPGVVVVRTSSDGGRRSMTYLPMSPAEIDMHSNKHVHSLLSAKLALEAHVEELQVKGKPTMSREALDEALWQYAMFRQKRFNWPEMDPFAYDTELNVSQGDHECESEELARHFVLPRTQTTDGLTPIRLFEIFEVTKFT
ncbi:hypothetical protein EDB86DRAFT_2135572 [Lactarius hatsudake]|nr:hypothetical protein EDB86DRAFT_2135572 [Lactarius hatsudake]